MKKILLIESDKGTARLLAHYVAEPNFQLEVVPRGVDGLRKALTQSFDLIIQELILPDMNGLDVCRHLRERHATVPLLILSARREEVDKVLALELGADDYVTKPFSVRELLARIKALLRRGELLKRITQSEEPGALDFEGLHIDPLKRCVQLARGRIELTAKEFDLLYQLAANPGRSYSRLDLLRKVWGYQSEGYEHTVTSHINRLRTKIEPEPAHPRYILTVWGIGYRFTDRIVSPDSKPCAILA